MEEQLRDAEAVDLMNIDVVRCHEEWALLLAGRAAYDDARGRVARGRAALGLVFEDERALALALVEARVELWSGNTSAATDAVLAAVDEPRRGLSACSDAGPRLLAVAAAATTDASLLAGLRARLDAWIAAQRWDGGEPADVVPIVAQLAAEEHRDDASAWSTVAEMWEVGSRLPHVAYARFREAEAHLLRDHDTDAAATAARVAHDLAHNMGFVWLRDNVAALARRGRLDLGIEIARPSTPAALSLTPRELEVLLLVAEGATNRQIAEQLYISAKTASVHVSNILGKMGVAGRVEAAGLAIRLGLAERQT
jgi:DNA-binding CsgD family transcriptional regulator